MEMKEIKEVIYLQSYNAASSSPLAQSSVHVRIHRSPASTDCPVAVSRLYMMLHPSFSSDAQGIYTCNSTGASGFKFRVTGTLVII